MSEDNFHPHHKNINCKSCVKYIECKSIESKHVNKLKELEGNWRALFDSGQRVGTPIRRCSHAIVETYRKNFIDKLILEIGCGSSSEIDYKFCNQNNVEYIGLDPERLPLYSISNILHCLTCFYE